MNQANGVGRKGVTLIELMIALVISAALVATLYGTFLTQHHAYTVQDDVLDMQQNVRVALNEMMREIRMAGFGNIGPILPLTISGKTYNYVINPDVPSKGALTILAAIGGATTLTGLNPPPDHDQIRVSGTALFDTIKRKYISIAGIESYGIMNISANTLTLDRKVVTSFKTGGNTPVYAIRAITYLVPSGTTVLRRNENLGGGAQPLAEDIENVTFQYFDENGNPTLAPLDFRTIRVTVTARTKRADLKFKAGAGDGYRRRHVASNILLRNMGL